MHIKACIRCGSRNIRMGTIRDGVLIGYSGGSGEYICDDCDYRGTPMMFETEKEYAKYREARSNTDDDA